jgi:hypothetical protein
MRLKRPLVVAIVLLGACKPPTPAKQMDSIKSWLATEEMVGEGWLRRSTPDKYSRETLELSRETLFQISNDLLAALPPQTDSAMLDSVLVSAHRHVDRMARLITARNSPDFRIQLDSLRADEKLVKALSEGMSEQ